MLWGCSEQRTVRDECVNTEVGLRSARVSIGNTPVLIPHLGTELRFTVGLRLGADDYLREPKGEAQCHTSDQPTGNVT